ncbi:hypothetical protein RHMOL_Rhmol01G0056500 [Rhododendron molle]|uniref:Uncharacterized protein n=1 Tax=Rhododendron molle TaxID=49168 RepID=A0ACC0Q0A1_RHOML|nr:hypothetical protein RHMOL_Rhmol01G0056500 [Rhododendron molle]
MKITPRTNDEERRGEEGRRRSTGERRTRWTPLMVARSWNRDGLEEILSSELEEQSQLLPSSYLCLPLMSIVKIASYKRRNEVEEMEQEDICSVNTTPLFPPPPPPCEESGNSSEEVFTPEVKNEVIPKLRQEFKSLDDVYKYYKRFFFLF